jgi:molybdenum cofactor synthesis domain-containing protein
MSPNAALGHSVAADAVSSCSVPGFDSSAMDGFAIVTDGQVDAPFDAEVVDSVMAGQAPATVLRPGQAARIMTGAPIPLGADAVCPLEETLCYGDRVTVTTTIRRGDHLRHAGEDVRPGDVVVAAGAVVGPVDVGLLEAVGCATIRCYPTPTVGVLSTGDELLADGPGGIRDSNRAALIAALTLDRVPTVDLGVVADRPAALADALRDAVGRCDAIITTGGVSVGDRDVVRMVLEQLPTVTHRWMQVAVKPAKPFAFAVLDGPVGPVPLFALPGNPVAALVSYELFARPGLRRMAGHHQWWRPVTEACAQSDFANRRDGRVHVVPSIARIGDDGRAVVWPCPRQGSHLLTSLAPANALVVLPPDVPAPAGTDVSAWILDPAALFADRLVAYGADSSRSR